MGHEAGVEDALQIQAATDGHQQCLYGFHAMTPWLCVTNDDGLRLKYVAQCMRDGCEHAEQYDL